ncbi:hypothetical protein CTEN210_13965 [Chaetoceros tenuissimus]|uniref:Uncharacterized protein n=1 Tax=Chaetoceros tenuissimus TaxID=426638 RepID=A0AAD3D4B1_9STRA|nr:hypothetical protein CTEN210_13965 [Chaetoceros tenuissimus]
METNQVVVKEENELFNSPSQKISSIDGIGLWNSFTRSFQSPLMACFDLIDNVFDASSQFHGYLEIDVDVEEEKDEEDENRIPELELDSTNGFYMLNNCHHAVKPMKEVLTVFNSEKGSARSQIGENGVGVKQGCATLSDISFVMSRNEQVYSLGILAKELQKKQGIYLPSFEFAFDKEFADVDDSYTLYSFLKAELTSIANLNKDIAKVYTEYGYGDEKKGIHRLITNMMRLSDGIWADEKYAFCLCIHDLKHGDNTDFLLNISSELSRHYLHVPKSFQVWVGSIRVKFNHWPNRLVNLTRFMVRIPKDEHANDAPTMMRANQQAFTITVASLVDSSSLTVMPEAGALPLNPTKQDFAFGEHQNGSVWEQNLHKWVSAVTKVYYNYYLENLCDGQKRTLTDLVKNRNGQAKKKDVQQGNQNMYKSIDELEVSTFEGIKWKYMGDSHSGSFHLTKKQSLKESLGEDIDLLFKKPKSKGAASSSKKQVNNKKKSKAKTSTARVTHAVSHDMVGSESDEDMMASSNRSFQRSAKAGSKRYREDTEEDITEEEDISKFSSPVPRKKTSNLELENAQLKQELENSQRKFEQLERRFTEAKLFIKSLEKERDDAQLDIETLEGSERELKDTLSRREREINRLKRDLAHEKATETSMDF